MEKTKLERLKRLKSESSFALEVLEKNQPMPTDAELDEQKSIKKWIKMCQKWLVDPSKEDLEAFEFLMDVTVEEYNAQIMVAINWLKGLQASGRKTVTLREWGRRLQN